MATPPHSLHAYLCRSRAPQPEAGRANTDTNTCPSFDAGIAEFARLKSDPSYTYLSLEMETFGVETHFPDGHVDRKEVNVTLGEVKKIGKNDAPAPPAAKTKKTKARKLLAHLHYSKYLQSEMTYSLFQIENFDSFDAALAKFAEMKKDPSYCLLALEVESFGVETYRDGHPIMSGGNLILGEVKKIGDAAKQQAV